jgi:RNA 3'-terminal phosphate cyclase (ATP)
MRRWMDQRTDAALRAGAQGGRVGRGARVDMTDWIALDGAEGEGGGQILRTALALSLVTARPFRIERIRAARRKPGLLRQHLTAVQAAANVGHARVTGAELGSAALSFEPRELRSGEYRLSIGTAGSATLVFQTVLPALLCARGASQLTLEGGTHNPTAPPFDFVASSFLPIIRRMGPRVDARLDAYGFYPAGGGRITVEIEPSASLGSVELLDRGPVRVHARALVSSLPETIAKRELAIVRERLGIERAMCRVECITNSIGPGNVLLIAIESDRVTEVVSGFGVKGVSAEKVASLACDEAERYLDADVPVGAHLADQLLIPMALAKGGTFRTVTPTEHTVTNAKVIERFLGVSIAIEPESFAVARITVAAA